MAEIHDQTFGLGGEGIVEVPAQGRSGEHVYLTGHVRDHNRVVVLKYGDRKQLSVG